jgi:hypothetical protein
MTSLAHDKSCLSPLCLYRKIEKENRELIDEQVEKWKQTK